MENGILVSKNSKDEMWKNWNYFFKKNWTEKKLFEEWD